MTGNVLAKCYETKIGKLQKRAPKWYQNFFEKEKEKKKWRQGCEWYKNLPEHE